MKPEATAEASAGGGIAPAPAAAKVQTPFQRFAADFLESRIAVVGLVITTIVVFIAIFAPLIAPTDPFDLAKVDVMDNLIAPGDKNFAGDFTYVLGTDGSGRDMLSAIFYGLRTSITVGVSSGLIALALGMSVGLAAAYFGGFVDTLIMRIVDIQLSFPAILIALVFMAVLGPGIDKTIMALIVAQWAYYARTVRGSALVERRKEYVEAATCLALSHRRIVFRHLLPNCLPPLIVVATVQTAHAISLEATLSFLGLGVPQTEPSLGMLIRNGFDYMHSHKYWITFFPGVALLVTIVGINLVGDQLRDILNPRLQK
ncbi:MAG: ABC transporter permease [Rhodospirillales bacterium]